MSKGPPPWRGAAQSGDWAVVLQNGQFDGSRWKFPKGNYYNIKAKALARDPEGRIWVGSDRGVMEVIDDTKRHFIGTRTGLLDDHVLNLQVDVRGRVWTLTEKGISIIEPLQ